MSAFERTLKYHLVSYNTSELRRSTTVVYRRNRQALSTARFCRAGQLERADTCRDAVLAGCAELAADVTGVDVKNVQIKI